ncbi:hypothetical protein ACJMK2_005351, partial [Sinanodonta woodiana]
MDDQSFLSKMGITATISDVVRNCKEGKTAYIAFQLENSATMGFNMKQIQDDIDKSKKEINVKLKAILDTLSSLDPSNMNLGGQLQPLDTLESSLKGFDFATMKAGNKLEEALGHLEALGNEVGLNNKLGKCTPLWNLYNSLLLVSFCKYTVDAFNGFWFSIGWCIFFFMPGIILAVILEKYFRRMNTVGVIGDSTS